MMAVPFGLLLLAAEGGHDNVMLWRIINFVLLAGLLGWLIRKNAGPFFASRSESIIKDILESRKKVEESEARSKAIDQRLAGLGREIEELKAKAKAEITAEHARLERETEAAVKKVFAFAEQDMAAAVKTARAELRAHTARLAVELAEKKIASRMTPEVQRSILAAFARQL